MENKELNNSLTSDDLGIVTGGEKVGHTGFITCPYCGSSVPVSLKQIELHARIICPACGQQIDINNK